MSAPFPPAVDADEFLISRQLDVPRERVFAAWTDSRQLAQWWAPSDFNMPVCDLDARPDGAYRIVMRSPDGEDYPITGVYREIVAPDHLVFTMDCTEHPAAWHNLVKPDRTPDERNPAGEMVSLVTLDEHDGGTLLTVRIRFESTAIRDAFAAMDLENSWSEILARLDAILAADPEIISTRLFDASRDDIWRAFSDPEQLARWWGPVGFTNTFREYDFRPGGHWRFIMHGPDGTDYPNHSVFLEVAAPARIVFRHLDPVHEFQMTIIFSEEEDQTRLTWHMRFPTAAKCDEVRAFVTIANEQNFDRLESALATCSSH